MFFRPWNEIHQGRWCSTTRVLVSSFVVPMLIVFVSGCDEPDTRNADGQAFVLAEKSSDNLESIEGKDHEGPPTEPEVAEQLPHTNLPTLSGETSRRTTRKSYLKSCQWQWKRDASSGGNHGCSGSSRRVVSVGCQVESGGALGMAIQGGNTNGDAHRDLLANNIGFGAIPLDSGVTCHHSWDSDLSLDGDIDYFALCCNEVRE